MKNMDKSYPVNQVKKLSLINWDLTFFFSGLGLIAFLMFYAFNRYLPFQDGWFHYYVLLTQRGELPYRDFFYFLQPIPLFMFELLAKIGPEFIVSRYYGVFERLVLFVVLYYLLRKEFSPSSTFVGVLGGIFLYQSHNSDVMYSYYQTTLLLFLIVLLCFKKAETSSLSGLYFLISGIFASLVFFTKQSNGLVVFLLSIFLLFLDGQFKQGLKRLFPFLVGYFIPLTIIIGWLVKFQLMTSYISQVFGGASSKGPIAYILLGFFNRHYAPENFLIIISIVLLLVFAVWQRWTYFRIVDKIETDNDWNCFLLVGFILFSVLGFLVPLSTQNATGIFYIEKFYGLLWVYSVFFVLFLLSLNIGFRWISRKPQIFSPAISRLILGSFAWMYAHGMSYQLEEHGTLLGFAVVLAIFFDRIQSKNNSFRFIILTAVFLVALVGVIQKRQIPYSWWGWIEYGHIKTVTSSVPVFRGFHLSPENNEFYETVYKDILEHSTQNDTIYTYPHIPIFNYITNRLQPTFSPVHYFDVCPDPIAIQDAELLKRNPPKMIIFLDMPENVYQFHENGFRDGHLSGQREIVSVVQQIVLQYNYKKIRTLYTPGYEWPLIVWVKP